MQLQWHFPPWCADNNTDCVDWILTWITQRSLAPNVRSLAPSGALNGTPVGSSKLRDHLLSRAIFLLDNAQVWLMSSILALHWFTHTETLIAHTPLTFLYKLVYTYMHQPSCSRVWSSGLDSAQPSASSLVDPPRKNSSHLDVRPAGAERSREGAPDRRRKRRRRLALFHYCAPCYRTAKLWEGVKKPLLAS